MKSRPEDRETAARTLVWVHEDCLRPEGPALERYPEAPALSVIDEQVLDERGTSLKQLVFIYKSLLEIPRLQIVRGDTVEALISAARQGEYDRIATTESASPEVRRVCRNLESRGLCTEEVSDAPFVDLTPEEECNLDLKRFSRYWRSIKKLGI